MTERLGSGLQNRPRQFESAWHLFKDTYSTIECVSLNLKESMKTSNTRSSNFELLRIVSMILIVLHHMLIATGQIDYSKNGKLLGGEMVNGFAIVGVNCFILISGYFGIRFRLSKLFYLLYAIAFVCFITFLLSLVLPLYFDYAYVQKTLIPIHHKANWFIPTYIGLMLLSPLINKGLVSLSREETTKLVISLTLFNIYAFASSLSAINPNGYTLIQFIYLYIVGAYIRQLPKSIPLWLPLTGYLACSIGTGIYARYVHTGFQAYAYNNPIVLLGSLCLFLAFKQIQLQNVLINKIAETTFIVFLFHYSLLQHIKDTAFGHPLQHAAYLSMLCVFIFFMAFLLSAAITPSFAFLSCLIRRLRP